MKYSIFLLNLFLLLSCSSNKLEENNEPEQLIFDYDTEWLLEDSERILPASPSNNTVINKTYKINGKTYHKSGNFFCEFNGTKWINCTNTMYGLITTVYKNKIYGIEYYIKTNTPFKMKILNPDTFNDEEFTVNMPKEVSSNEAYYTSLEVIDDNLYMICSGFLAKNIFALKLNNHTKQWELATNKFNVDLRTTNFRTFKGLPGEILLILTNTDGDFIYKYDKKTFTKVFKFEQRINTNSRDSYADILVVNNQYLLIEGESGKMRFFNGNELTGDTLPSGEYIQYVAIEGNYLCIADGYPTGPAYEIKGFRFYNLKNNKLARFTNKIDLNNS